LIATLKGSGLNPITSGNNSAIRASAYAAVGGTPKLQRCEDSFLGVALARLRNAQTTILRPHSNQAINVETSARRVLAAWQQGYAPNEKWKLGFSAHDSSVRMMPNPSDEAHEEGHTILEDQEAFDDRLEYILNRMLLNYESEGDDPIGWESSLYKEAFALLGLNYDITHNQDSFGLRMGDTADIRSALREYRTLKTTH
jgi:hypothetical protein